MASIAALGGARVAPRVGARSRGDAGPRGRTASARVSAEAGESGVTTIVDPPRTPEEADAYFQSRRRESRLGAIASQQSRPLTDRATLMGAVAALSERYGDGPIPRPAHWTGFRITPVSIEFWQNGDFRLHDRVRFTRTGEGWSGARLYP